MMRVAGSVAGAISRKTAPPEVREQTAARGGARLVVVVDDEPAIVEGLRLLLNAWGMEVLAAHTVGELTARLAGAPARPCLVLADYYLPPGNTGADVVGIVRSHCGYPVPAIILTGDTAPERQAEASALGAHLLHKPVQIATLRQAIDRALAA
jgi:CheY-like chemotaxis protein